MRENIITSDQIQEFEDKIKRMCKSFDDCKDCPLYSFKGCKDTGRALRDSIEIVQAWEEANPETIKLGDIVRIRENYVDFISPRYSKFILKYGTDIEKTFWQYNKLPDKCGEFTVSSIHNHTWIEGRKMAIITREELLGDCLEVYVIEASKLEKVR